VAAQPATCARQPGIVQTEVKQPNCHNERSCVVSTQENTMADDKHEKALDLTEAALDAMDKGDEDKADKLIDQAKKLDPSAPKEVLQDLEES
jgi:hypothetical protein